MIHSNVVCVSQARSETNLTLLPNVDIAIIVSDVTQELTAPELNFLKQASSLCPRLSCVVSKKDLQHQWRLIAGANQEHQQRSEEHTSELQSRGHLVCRLLLEKKKKQTTEDQKLCTINTIQ